MLSINLSSMRLILVICLIFLLISPFYQQTTQDKQAYLQSLLQIENKLKDKINELNKVNQLVQNQKSNYDDSLYLKKTLIQQAMEVQAPQIVQIQNLLQIPYEKKTWQCQNLTKYQQNQILAQTNQIQNQLNNIKSMLNSDTTCSRDLNLKTSTDSLQNRLYYLQKQLNSACQIKAQDQNNCQNESQFWNGNQCVACSSPRIFNTDTLVCQCQNSQNYYYNEQSNKCQKILYIPNLSASQNWIYGQNYNVNTYAQNMNQLAMDNHVIKCPDQYPYLDQNNKCVKCGQNQIFGLSMNKCWTCPQNKILDESAHQCNTGGIVDGNKIICQKNLYWSGRECIKCDGPGIFDTQKRQCVCQDGYIYDSSAQNCNQIKPKIKNTNPGAVNYKGDLPKYDDFTENCPGQTPYFNGESCIECKLPKYYNLQANACQLCNNAMIFDIAQRSCTTQISGAKKYNSNFAKNKIFNYAGSPPDFDDSISNCPTQKPYFDGFNCVPCSRPFYFNFTSNKCQACVKGQSFNEVSKSCAEPLIEKKIFKSNINPNIKNYRGTPSYQNQNQNGNGNQGQTSVDWQNGNVETCPIQNPFFNGKQCISCLQPHYFSFDSLKCESCSAETNFSFQDQDCIKKQPNAPLFNSNFVNFENFKGSIPKFNPGVQTCPQDKAFFNGKKCESCKLPLYFDFFNNQCKSCLDKQFFNVQTRQCQYHEQKFLTDIKNPNIYYNGQYAEVIRGIQEKMKNDNTITMCPQQKPFYNPNLGQCITCDGQKKLYDIKFNRCISCHKGSYFSEQKHFCISQGVVHPTVERMFMNTFSWI